MNAKECVTMSFKPFFSFGVILSHISVSISLKHSDKIETCVPIKGRCLIKTLSFWLLKQINSQAFIRCYIQKQKGERRGRQEEEAYKTPKEQPEGKTLARTHTYQRGNHTSRVLCPHAVHML